jgi:hypothetical protein
MTIRTAYVPPKCPSVYVVNGLRFRVDQGAKKLDDRVVWLARCDRDRKLSYPSLGAVVAALARNEDVLYPNGQGGEYLLGFLRACFEVGLIPACDGYGLRRPVVERIRGTK